jgi:hypothetical protein
VVDNLTVCVGGGLGGVANVNAVLLIERVGGGDVTFKVTAIANVMGAEPVVVTVTLSEYVPGPRPVGFTWTAMVAGILPLSGAMVIQSEPFVMDVV